MPLFEFICPVHGKFERILDARKARVICMHRDPCLDRLVDYNHFCMEDGVLVEFSVPAKRDPEKGIQS